MKKWTLAAFDESEAYPELVWGGVSKSRKFVHIDFIQQCRL